MIQASTDAGSNVDRDRRYDSNAGSMFQLVVWWCRIGGLGGFLPNRCSDWRTLLPFPGEEAGRSFRERGPEVVWSALLPGFWRSEVLTGFLSNLGWLQQRHAA